MNAQDLFDGLCELAEAANARTDVQFFAWTRDCRYELHTITTVTTSLGADGEQSITIVIKEAATTTHAAQSPRRPEQVLRARRRRVMSPGFLARVASIYRVALADGNPPTQAVAERFEVPHRTATRWVSDARKAGVLGRALGTRAGEASTESGVNDES